jgi:L-ascorbate metabolism protein UlaG (beta-lactamase superfamily)
LPLLGEYFFGGAEREPRAPLPLQQPQGAWRGPAGSGLRLTWLGHSTVLLEIDGLRVLTDPVFGLRASPLSFAGPKRFHATPVRLDELPPLDAILLSHDHYDHLCADTMRQLARGAAPVVTSLGVGARLEALGFAPDRVHELDWGEHVDLGGLRLRATPCQHFSGRGAADRNQTLWSSWVIESSHHKVFFSGDTGLTDDFAAIGAAYGPFDLVMLEVGAFHEAWGDIHLGPHNALRAFEMLRGQALLPVHWGTFNLALHAWDEPAETLLRVAAERGHRVLTPMLGAAVEPSRVEGPSPWWRGIKAPGKGA